MLPPDPAATNPATSDESGQDVVVCSTSAVPPCDVCGEREAALAICTEEVDGVYVLVHLRTCVVCYTHHLRLRRLCDLLPAASSQAGTGAVRTRAGAAAARVWLRLVH